MHARVLFKLALLAPPLYLAAVVWGSSITPGYSHRHQAISELTQRGAANTGPVEALFVLSALCVAALGAGVLRLWGADRRLRLAGWLLLIGALFNMGIGSVIAMDPMGAPSTPLGQAHTGLAVLSGLAMMGAIALTANALPRLRRLSLVCLIAMVFGVIGVPIILGLGIDAIGVMARITISGWLIWLGALALAGHRAAS